MSSPSSKYAAFASIIITTTAAASTTTSQSRSSTRSGTSCSCRGCITARTRPSHAPRQALFENSAAGYAPIASCSMSSVGRAACPDSRVSLLVYLVIFGGVVLVVNVVVLQPFVYGLSLELLVTPLFIVIIRFVVTSVRPFSPLVRNVVAARRFAPCS